MNKLMAILALGLILVSCGSTTNQSQIQNATGAAQGHGSQSNKEQVAFFDSPASLIAHAGSLQVGSGGDLSSIAISGNYAFVGKSAGLFIIDISNPSSPVQAKKFTLSDATLSVTSVLASGSTLYVGTDNNPAGGEFFILDISSPLDPTIKGSLEFGTAVSNNRGIFVAGNTAYATTVNDNGPLNEFHVIDISDPAAPVETGGISTTYNLNGVNSAGKYAYVARTMGFNTRQVMDIVDVSNAAAPQIVSSIGVGKSIQGGEIAVQGNYAYLSVYDSASIYDFAIIDVSNPTTPVLAKYFSLGSRSLAVNVSGKYAYITRGHDYALGATSQDFYVIDISNPPNAAILASLGLGAHSNDLAISGNYAYVTCWGNSNGNFQVIDISGLTNQDVTPPTVGVTEPAANATLSGNIKLSAAASDNIRVATVQFQADGANIGGQITAPDIVSPFTIVWDTATTADGLHNLQAIATDTSGNASTSAAVQVTVNNAGGDKIPPAISIALPAAGSSASNAIMLSANATDNMAVASVQFKINGNDFGPPVSAPPYILVWDTAASADGTYAVSAVATDTSGNSATAQAISVTTDNRQHWYTAFTPIREFYVSPNGAGNGSSQSSPMSLASAVSSANPGDEYWLLAGTYPVGRLILARAGTASNPIVYRAMPGQHAIINGTFYITGAYNWVWGFDITDPGGTSGYDGIAAYSKGTHAINNTIHDLLSGGNGIGGWMNGEGQVFYGNIIFSGTTTPLSQRGHNIYTQNKFSDYGYKYYVSNISIDPPQKACNLVRNQSGIVTSANDCFTFHAYTEGGYIQGFHLEKNIFTDGRVLLGGYNVPTDHEVMKNNYFYKTGPQLGYARPTQAEVKNNYIGRGSISADWLWGEGEIQFTQYAPNIFTGNEVYPGTGKAITIRTSAYTVNGRQEGVTQIRKTDIVGNNIYSAPFSAALNANNSNLTYSSLAAWQAATTAAGNPFDTQSQVVPFPPANKTIVIPNEYESGRGNIAIYNWSKAGNANVSLSSAVANGATYNIYNAKDTWGSPVASGTYNGGTVSVPTGGAEFLALVVTSSGAAQNPQSPTTSPANDMNTATDTDIDGVPDNIDKCPSTPAILKTTVNAYGCAMPITTKFDIKPDFNTMDLNSANNTFSIGISGTGKITFSNIKLAYAPNRTETRLDLDSAINITRGSVTVNTANAPALNAPATITLYNISMQNPKIKADGNTCTACTIQSYGSGTIIFTVPNFNLPKMQMPA
ncbi:LVIVD repeat protein [uncultured archaeon]|nr:LVIVD repeat protein [uncultured archaeon]